ncbi:MAG: nucleotidyltransferase family protein [Luteolibacter sp.]
MITGAIILAAGSATRFGGRKQLLEMNGETLIDRACRTALAAGCRPVLRVLGACANEILQRPELPDVATLVHRNWSEGMGSSLAAGIGELLKREPKCEAIFILLADQPLVSPELLQQMLHSLDLRFSMVLCDYGESSGPPALFKRVHFPELMKLTGDRGAKLLAANHPGAVAWLPFPGGLCDIDSKEAWEDLQLKLAERNLSAVLDDGLHLAANVELVTDPLHIGADRFHRDV